MKRLFTAVLMGLMVASLALAQNADALITELRAVTGAPTRNATELRAAYDAVLDALLVPLSDETNEDQLMPREGGPILARQGAQVALRDIALRSTRTGAEVERLALSQAIAARLGQVPNVYAQAWLVRMLEFIGRAEAVPALTGLLLQKRKKHQLKKPRLQRQQLLKLRRQRLLRKQQLKLLVPKKLQLLKQDLQEENKRKHCFR